MDSSQKLTNTDVKKLNKNRIFRLIYNSDKISRQEIADQLGLSLPTVNQNLKMLMEDGGGRKSGLGAALSFVARFIDGVE
jgi:predicted ArsR family transcriptional regulator